MCCAQVGQLVQSIHEPIKLNKKDYANIVDEINRKDILERRYLAGRILKRLSEDDCPSVIGVYGGWGTGKTSLINLLDCQNDQMGENSGLCIEIIDAWKYESKDGLLIPIIARLNKISKGAGFKSQWLKIIARFVGTTIFSSVEIFLKEFAGVDRDKIRNIYKELDELDTKGVILEEWVNQANEIEKIDDAFNWIVGETVKELKKDKIVFCIDNLDRCSPDNVVKLLESVKVFFNDSPKCIWMFVMASDVVASYINRKYEGTEIDGYSYLDKIIPEQFHLSLSPTADQKIIASLLKYASKSNYDVQIDISEIPQIPKVLVPRRLIKSAKKFADYYDTNMASSGVPPKTVMALSMLYHTWPAFYQRLSSASKDHIKRILDNFFQKEIQKTEDQKNRRMNIPLEERFLRDKELVYFIQTAFAGYNSASSEKYIVDILHGLQGLREGGLP